MNLRKLLILFVASFGALYFGRKLDFYSHDGHTISDCNAWQHIFKLTQFSEFVYLHFDLVQLNESCVLVQKVRI